MVQIFGHIRITKIIMFPIISQLPSLVLRIMDLQVFFKIFHQQEQLMIVPLSFGKNKRTARLKKKKYDTQKMCLL